MRDNMMKHGFINGRSCIIQMFPKTCRRVPNLRLLSKLKSNGIHPTRLWNGAKLSWVTEAGNEDQWSGAYCQHGLWTLFGQSLTSLPHCRQ